MKDISSKIRMLKVKEILENETDEAHEFSLDEILKRLNEAFGGDFWQDKKAVKRDIEDLAQTGFDVIENTGKYGKKYYSHQVRRFELFELRMLIDAVLSAKFITKEESENLIKKIKTLTSVHHAKKLPSQVFFDQAVKGNYQQIKIDIDRIHEAVTKSKRIYFQYGKYNVHKQFELHRDGEFYPVEPYGLIWSNEFYYCIGRFEDEPFFRHYRVDRMRNVSVSDESFKRMDVNLSEYIYKTFHMYGGEDNWIHIRFDNELINVIIDRFGLGVEIEPVSDTHFDLKTKASISDGLIRWILTWGSMAKVIAPLHLAEKIKEESRKMAALYEHET
ncbi:hypothetical protein BpJC7_02210 [Weizmannia acidilactici]|uniref:WYL domain-containing protein n=1 Tax=Weizmannia acidilactici TaxID=2607726 RepID=A0A5J4JF11_9BACI|nr:WYL domain-containing protein [Weizmannia acidilactici]GER67679.1 hypothetical protein BpJC4_21500 [Weizmannia acidilactici]GER68918.1 hypothetical protein BpJC7_02210 [Weizmannia acidilactici]GER73902.1 hypothetical protein BpPP18_19690 [Weizmannia acidilactici]